MKLSIKRMGMAEARLNLPRLAAELARAPSGIVEITRRGKPVLHLVAPPAIEGHANAARRILQRIARLPPVSVSAHRDAARRYKELLYGRD